MQIVACTYEQHATPMLAILNEAIVTSTALFDYEPRPPESMVAWFETKRTAGFPVFGAVADGRLLGFATYGVFRAWPAYKYSVEHSVYIDRTARRQGVGLALMRALIRAAQREDLHTLIAGIDASNSASVALHAKLGFEHVGTVRQAGYKFGRWLDLALYQLILDTPRHPRDGTAPG